MNSQNPNSLEEERDFCLYHFHMSPLLVIDDACTEGTRLPVFPGAQYPIIYAKFKCIVCTVKFHVNIFF